MSSGLDQELNDSMQSSLESFFVSLREGPNMLNGFLRTWTAFNHTVQTHRDKLKEETLESIHHFAATIGTVAAAMLELEVEKEKVSDILNDQMDNLFIEKRRGSEGMII
jgi:Mating-type protein beta 1